MASAKVPSLRVPGVARCATSTPTLIAPIHRGQCEDCAHSEARCGEGELRPARLHRGHIRHEHWRTACRGVRSRTLAEGELHVLQFGADLLVPPGQHYARRSCAQARADPVHSQRESGLRGRRSLEVRTACPVAVQQRQDHGHPVADHARAPPPGGDQMNSLSTRRQPVSRDYRRAEHLARAHRRSPRRPPPVTSCTAPSRTAEPATAVIQVERLKKP